MSWIAIKLFASGVLDAVLKGLSSALKWLLADWRNIAAAGFSLALAWTLLVTVPGLRADLAATETSLTAERSAHLGTVNAFLAASEQAQKDAEANAQRVAREQEIITDAKLAEYRADLGDLRARFDRLRRARDAAQGNPGRADAAGLPGLPAAAGGIDAPAGQARLPAAGGLTLEDALIASEQALQLQALIDWVAAQSAVRFTPEEPR